MRLREAHATGVEKRPLVLAREEVTLKPVHAAGLPGHAGPLLPGPLLRERRGTNDLQAARVREEVLRNAARVSRCAPFAT